MVKGSLNPYSPDPNPSAARFWLELTDAQLLSQCELDTYRASGPGGQKRNKTSSAVRLRHGETGTIVTATESRSQHENRDRALCRLREAIALHQRSRIDPAAKPPAEVLAALDRGPGLRINRRNPDYFKIIQFLLDLLLACQASVSDAAERLGLSTAQLVRFLKCDDKLWAQVNQIRQDHGLRPLV